LGPPPRRPPHPARRGSCLACQAPRRPKSSHGNGGHSTVGPDRDGPPLGDRKLPRSTDGQGRLRGWTPQRDIGPACASPLLRREGPAANLMSSSPTCTTTTSNRRGPRPGPPQAAPSHLVKTAADPGVLRADTGTTDGEVVRIGAAAMRITAVGHAGPHVHSTCPMCSTDGRTTGEQVAVITPGASAAIRGRPGGPGPARRPQHTPRPWCGRSMPSVRKLAGMLPDAAQVFPTHGFGSFCSATQTEAVNSTDRAEKGRPTPALTPRRGGNLLSGSCLPDLTTTPGVLSRTWRPANAGPGRPSRICRRPGNCPTRLSCGRRHRGRRSGWWTLRTPDRVRRRARCPVAETFGLDGSFAPTYPSAWLIQWGNPLTLARRGARTTSPRAQARACSASGFEPAGRERHPAIQRTGSAGTRHGAGLLPGPPAHVSAKLAQVAAPKAGHGVLDVRRADESGGVPGSRDRCTSRSTELARTRGRDPPPGRDLGAPAPPAYPGLRSPRSFWRRACRPKPVRDR